MSNIQSMSINEFNGILIYAQTLVSLNRMVEKQNKQQVNIHTDRELVSIITYQFLEILLKIFELIPLKIDYTNTTMQNKDIDLVFKELEDHFFSDNISLNQIRDKLKKVTTRYQAFFFFNSIARNVLLHHKHDIHAMDESSTGEYIVSIRYRITIEKGGSKAIRFFEKIFGNYSKVEILKERITVEKSSNKYYLRMNLDFNHVKSIVNEINDLFLSGLDELAIDISNSNESSIDNSSKERYIGLIEYWKQTIIESINQ